MARPRARSRRCGGRRCGSRSWSAATVGTPSTRSCGPSASGGRSRGAAGRRLRAAGRLPRRRLPRGLGPHPRLPGRDNRRAVLKAVVFYESATDLAEKAPLHAAAHRARWREFADRGELLMIGPFAHAQEDGAMAIFTTRKAAEEFVR